MFWLFQKNSERCQSMIRGCSQTTLTSFWLFGLLTYPPSSCKRSRLIQVKTHLKSFWTHGAWIQDYSVRIVPLINVIHASAQKHFVIFMVKGSIRNAAERIPFVWLIAYTIAWFPKLDADLNLVRINVLFRK